MRSLLPALLLAAACQTTPPGGLTDSDKAAIQKGTSDAEARFNAQPSDFKAHAMIYYTADAVMMPPNGKAVTGAEVSTAGSTIR